MNTADNIFSGQMVGETAKTLSERFGKVLQKRQSMTVNRNDTSTSISTQMDGLSALKISMLTQGIFVGAVAENFDERIDRKIFHAEIVVDSAKVKAETANCRKIPFITDFTDETSSKTSIPLESFRAECLFFGGSDRECVETAVYDGQRTRYERRSVAD